MEETALTGLAAARAAVAAWGALTMLAVQEQAGRGMQEETVFTPFHLILRAEAAEQARQARMRKALHKQGLEARGFHTAFRVLLFTMQAVVVVRDKIQAATAAQAALAGAAQVARFVPAQLQALPELPIQAVAAEAAMPEVQAAPAVRGW